jgi:hypothetical protein
MAIGIVDLFEVVDVEDDGRQASVRGSGSRACFGRPLEEAAAIAQAGQGIGGGEPDQAMRSAARNLA